MNDWPAKRYKVSYQYEKGRAWTGRRGLIPDNDFPELFREIDAVDKELSDMKASSEDAERPKTKWIMKSEGCSVSCGEGKDMITRVLKQVN